MDKTLIAQEFRSIFQNSLKINARSMSIKTLLSERNLRRIDYSPYYQRNYVWDNTKQTFFIESVILGTEIPPLILFKTGAKIEVIDGRQRFETLKRFKENQLTLTIKGLKELQVLKKKSFNKLSNSVQESFLDSNIRVYEFEVINHPNLDEDVIDKIKKEIFRRYNTGITPLTREELDNAKYDEDEFSELFKYELKKNDEFLADFSKCFFPKEEVSEATKEGIISKSVNFIRRFRILNNFPISVYARGTNRTEILDLLYDFAKNDIVDANSEFEEFKKLIIQVLHIFNDFSDKPKLKNKLIYECLLWGLTILKKEEIDFDYQLYKDELKQHYLESNQIYSVDNSHYYGSIIDRFSDTLRFFSKLYGFNDTMYIKNKKFKGKIESLKQTEVDAAKSIDELTNLRLNKTNPISTPVDEIKNDIKTSRYLLRPSYQRQEKISSIKASSIIESILLGINLPPIFIFKREKIKEVVDGQQRLLAIIGFLGEKYNNEDGKLSYSKNNNFKLQGLKILTDYEGATYNDLPDSLKDKILDYVIDVIVIEESVNDKFDPIDLFIRLNYKPYPIKNNSFEMWNSIVNQDVIKSIKGVTNGDSKEWFFIRERVVGKPDRMLNEELITILAYILFRKSEAEQDEVIGFFPRQDRITCRLKDKKGLGDFLVSLDNTAVEKNKFVSAIFETDKMLKYFASLFDEELTKDSFNDFLNVKKSKTFRRSLQDFYIIWLVLVQTPIEEFNNSKTRVLENIRELLSIVRNTSNSSVDDTYINNFYLKLKEVSELK